LCDFRAIDKNYLQELSELLDPPGLEFYTATHEVTHMGDDSGKWTAVK
jgi:hypothetical protein